MIIALSIFDYLLVVHALLVTIARSIKWTSYWYNVHNIRPISVPYYTLLYITHSLNAWQKVNFIDTIMLKKRAKFVDN